MSAQPFVDGLQFLLREEAVQVHRGRKLTAHVRIVLFGNPDLFQVLGVLVHQASFSKNLSGRLKTFVPRTAWSSCTTTPRLVLATTVPCSPRMIRFFRTTTRSPTMNLILVTSFQ